MRIELDIECTKCGGTGVYVGFAECEGASVICHWCNGTGCEHFKFEYELFKERKIKKDVKRVFISGYGYCVGTKPITLDNGTYIDFSVEGVSYGEFLAGKMPQHIENLACPMLADQSACHKIKGFVDRCNALDGGYICSIPKCNFTKNKARCWERFNRGGDV